MKLVVRQFIKNDKEVNVINEDSLVWVKQLPDNYYDLMICDSPYGIGMSKSAGLSQKYSKKKLVDKAWDNEAPSMEFFEELMRVSKLSIIWGANHFIDNLPEPRGSASWLVWDKRENIIPERTFADCELAWTNLPGPARVFRWYWDGFLKRGDEERTGHPTQKPVALYEWILGKWGDKCNSKRILDPFGGSMSSAIACLNKGFNLDIIELDRGYWEAGCNRIDKHLRQRTIFDQIEEEENNEQQKLF